MPDSQSTPDEMLAYWQRVAGDAAPALWTKDHLGMFFQGFRPRGQGVDAAFEGVVGAEEILPRLMSVYAATAEGWEGVESEDFYFIVRRPQPLSSACAAVLAAAHLRKTAAIAVELSAAGGGEPAAELADLLAPLPNIEVSAGSTPWPPADDDPETLVYEVTADYMRHLKRVLAPVASHAEFAASSIPAPSECDHFLFSPRAQVHGH